MQLHKIKYEFTDLSLWKKGGKGGGEWNIINN